MKYPSAAHWCLLFSVSRTNLQNQKAFTKRGLRIKSCRTKYFPLISNRLCNLMICITMKKKIHVVCLLLGHWLLILILYNCYLQWQTRTTEMTLTLPPINENERICFRVRSKLHKYCSAKSFWSDWSRPACHPGNAFSVHMLSYSITSETPAFYCCHDNCSPHRKFNNNLWLKKFNETVLPVGKSISRCKSTYFV